MKDLEKLTLEELFNLLPLNSKITKDKHKEVPYYWFWINGDGHGDRNIRICLINGLKEIRDLIK